MVRDERELPAQGIVSQLVQGPNSTLHAVTQPRLSQESESPANLIIGYTVFVC